MCPLSLDQNTMKRLGFWCCICLLTGWSTVIRLTDRQAWWCKRYVMLEVMGWRSEKGCSSPTSEVFRSVANPVENLVLLNASEYLPAESC